MYSVLRQCLRSSRSAVHVLQTLLRNTFLICQNSNELDVFFAYCTEIHVSNGKKLIFCFVTKLSGHRYGSTLVPFSAEDTEAMKYKTEKCFKMLGFTKAENVHTV